MPTTASAFLAAAAPLRRPRAPRTPAVCGMCAAPPLPSRHSCASAAPHSVPPPSACATPQSSPPPAPSSPVSRRAVLVAAAAAAAAATAPGQASAGGDTPKIRQGRGDGLADRDSYTVYQVQNREDVTLASLSRGEALAAIGADDVRAVFIGEHHHSYVDRVTQARIVESLHRANRRHPVAVGLEMVEAQFQPVLDAYVTGGIDELDLYTQTEWETRWVWPFEQYLPLFRMVRRLRIPLVALSPDREMLLRVRSLDEGDAKDASAANDAFGGARFERLSSADSGYKAYVSANILQSYASHARAGLLRSGPNFSAFYSTRILRDEAMAANCNAYLEANPGALLVSIMGLDHVKFADYGVPGRLARRVADRAATRRAAAARADGGEGSATAGPLPPPAGEDLMTIKTVILNPTSVDAYNEKDGALMLELPRGKSREPAAIADYLWFSSSIDLGSRPRPSRRSPPLSNPKRFHLPTIQDLVNAQVES